MIGQRLKARNAAQRLAQAPTNPIAHDRVADLLGHGEADARVPTSGSAFERRFACSVNASSCARRPLRGPLKLGATGQSPQLGLSAAARPAVSSKASARAIEGGPRRSGANGVRPTGACGRARGGRSEPCDRRPSPCVRETRGGACERVCSVDRSASRLKLQSLPATRRRRSRATSQPGPRLAAISSREASREKMWATENRAGGL